jgi:hypothetical protein
MKSPVQRGVPGNVKMRGRKTRLMSCLCCEMIDFRWDQRIKQANKEIRDETQIKTDRART